MKTSKLIKRYLEESNAIKDKNIMLLIAYGSRITHNATKNSDLDILIITSQLTGYKSSRLIDGIPIDITITPLEKAETEIMMSKATGSSYFESVLKTGKVIIDNYNTYDSLCNLLNYQVQRKRKLNPVLFELAIDHITSFLFSQKNKEVHYYTALEFLRRLYHAKTNCTNIHLAKVYDLYTDKTKAKEKYMAKLPDENFITNYLNALKETNLAKQKKYLINFLKTFENDKIQDIITNPSFLDKNEIQNKLVTLNNAVIKCETMLLNNHPYANCLYFILIGELKNFYNKIYTQECCELLECYNDAIEAENNEERVRYLEKLFCLTDSEYRIDYNDFEIRI